MEMVESNVEIDSSQSAFHDGYPGNCIVPKSEVVEEDICKDGGLLKCILEQEEGCESPQDLDRVCVTYEACLLDTGRPVKKSDFGIWFKVKDGHFCPAFSMAVKTMKKGEKAIFTVKPQYGFGVEGKRDYTYRRGYYFSVPSNATLQITLELLTFKMKVPFSKTVLKVGEGYELPNKGVVVKVKLTGKLQDDTVFFTKGHGIDDDQAEPFEFKTNENQVGKGLDKAVMTMKKGEVARLTIGPKYAFGSQPKSALVPPNSTVLYEVELVSFVKGKELISDMNNKEKIEAALKKKEKGESLRRRREFARASKRFEKALKFIENDISFSDEEKRYVKDLKVYIDLGIDRCNRALNENDERKNQICEMLKKRMSCVHCRGNSMGIHML